MGSHHRFAHQTTAEAAAAAVPGKKTTKRKEQAKEEETETAGKVFGSRCKREAKQRLNIRVCEVAVEQEGRGLGQ